jgi:hypothetical protein
MCRVLANHTDSTPPAVPETPTSSPPLAVVEREFTILDIADSDNLPASLKPPGEAAIIDVDTFEYEDILKQPKMSVAACEGYTINFPDGKSPHTAYPFALHDTIILPWDYALKKRCDEVVCAQLPWLVWGIWCCLSAMSATRQE